MAIINPSSTYIWFIGGQAISDFLLPIQLVGQTDFLLIKLLYGRVNFNFKLLVTEEATKFFSSILIPHLSTTTVQQLNCSLVPISI